MFPCEFCEISKNTFFTEHLRTTATVNRHHIRSYLKRLALFLLLATDMYKVSNSFATPHINEILEVRNKHPNNRRQNSQFYRLLVKSVYHGTEKSFLFKTKSLGHTSKHLQKYR